MGRKKKQLRGCGRPHRQTIGRQSNRCSVGHCYIRSPALGGNRASFQTQIIGKTPDLCYFFSGKWWQAAGDPSGGIQNVPRGTGFRGYIQESPWCVLGGKIGSFIGADLHMRLLSIFVVFQETGSPLTHCEARSASVLLPQPPSTKICRWGPLCPARDALVLHLGPDT